MTINRYINEQFTRIGLYIKNNNPVNEYKASNDVVRMQLHFVNGSTNWLSISDKQLTAIHNILSSEE